MVRIVFETPNGEKTLNALDIYHEESRSAWIVETREGTFGGPDDFAGSFSQVIIPENRVYSVQMTEDEKIGDDS